MKRTKKTKTSARSKKRKLIPLSDTLALFAGVAGIASLWFAISYTDYISFQIHAAASQILLADEDVASSSEDSSISSSIFYEEEVSSSIAPDVKKVLDVTPPVISNVTVTDITSTAASINWKTDEFATGQVQYGTTLAYGSISMIKTYLEQAHAIRLSGLLPNKKYFFEVTSRDHDGNVTSLGSLTFTTLEATAAPVVHAAASAPAKTSGVLTCDFLQKQTSSAAKRGTFALALFKALDLKANSSTRQLYADVPLKNPSFQAVTALQRAGLMQGYLSPAARRFFGTEDAISPATKAIVIQRAQKKGLCE